MLLPVAKTSLMKSQSPTFSPVIFFFLEVYILYLDLSSFGADLGVWGKVCIKLCFYGGFHTVLQFRPHVWGGPSVLLESRL